MPLLEPIMKGLIEWIYEMVVSIMEYAAKELVGVMSMDMSYFEKTAPVIGYYKYYSCIRLGTFNSKYGVPVLKGYDVRRRL